ncbi:hypothetical protein NEIPOLOT_00452 [Neisseria polysaccharea ATCC 43768]|nr:hypothetical protein NEIPOLOT_00452 [Neisseria polysaccharea ATCC 43768]
MLFLRDFWHKEVDFLCSHIYNSFHGLGNKKPAVGGGGNRKRKEVMKMMKFLIFLIMMLISLPAY